MRSSFSILILSAALLAPLPARADDGAVVAASKLPVAARQSLATDVAQARKASPEAFAAVDRIASRLAELDAQKRGRYAPLTPMLKRLGPGALLPMLERAALQSPGRGALPDSAWMAWRISLVEASGMLRDRRSLPVFAAVLAGPDTDFDLLKVTSESIGRVGDDAAVQQLITLARQPGPRQQALLAGLGESRRLAAAQTLADAASGALGALDEQGARLVAKALGHVGSSWSWKTTTSHKDEETATRALAAQTLVDLFVARDGDARSTATAALLMVDDASTPQLIARARQGASAATAAALDELAQRFARNPAR